MAKKENPAYRDLGTAGQNFFVFHLEDILENFHRFEDGEYKKAKITEYFEKQDGFNDNAWENVRSRVNASLRIIRKGHVWDALDMVRGDSKSVLTETVIKAEELRRKIRTGEITLP